MERLDGETILINFDSGEYFSFRGPSADILWLIDAGVDRLHWLSILRDAFGASLPDAVMETDIESFLLELSTAGVIARSGPSQGPAVSLPDDYTRIDWTAPTIQGNEDLADLLLIDPIHDTDDEGWPQAKSG